MSKVLAVVYLTAIVLANLSVAAFGPASTIINAFLFIGLTLSTRDTLHDLWGDKVLRNMLMLIAGGGLISYGLNSAAGPIALASMAAFVISETLDTIVYTQLKRRPYLQRSNGSNLVGSLADSIVFPTLAFGALLPWVMLGQFAAKFVGGFFWSLLLNALRRRKAVTA